MTEINHKIILLSEFIVSNVDLIHLTISCHNSSETCQLLLFKDEPCLQQNEFHDIKSQNVPFLCIQITCFEYTKFKIEIKWGQNYKSYNGAMIFEVFTHFVRKLLLKILEFQFY